MILSVPHVLLSLRWIPPAFSILGSSPFFLTEWLAIRALSLPFPRRFYRRLDEFLYSNYQAMVGFFYETWSGAEFRFYGDKIPDEPENALYISNHQCSVDWIIPEVLCVKQGGYGGRARYILKDTLKYLPLYGWYLGHRGGIFVEKQTENRDQSKLIKSLQRYVEEKVPLWLVIFPEGHRYNQSRVQRSKEHARSLGLPELKHVLTPKTTGFELAMEYVGSHFSAVYDITICYEGMGKDGRATPPNLFNIFCGSCSKVHIHMRRVPIEDIPTDSEGQRAWLHDAYQRKDQILNEILTQGRCHAPKLSHPLFLSWTLPPTLFFSFTLAAAMATREGRLLWLAALGVFTAVTFTSALFNNKK